MERRLREHFAEEASDLQAPDDLWARLEGRLGEQDQPRFALLRGGVGSIGARPWIPAAAAAVLVAGLGIGAWALAGGTGGGGDFEAAPAATQAAQPAEDDAQVEAAAAATQAAAATEAPPERQAAATEVAPPEARAEQAGQRAEQVSEEEATTQAAAATPAPTSESPRAMADEAAPVEESEPQDTESSEPDEPSDDAEPAAVAAEEDVAEDDMAADDMAEDDMADGDMAGDDMADGDMADAAMEEEAEEEEAAVSAEEAAPRRQQQPSDTTFEDYERTAFVSTATDAVSTFSLDTDRTSYFLALTWAGAGYIVDPDSVRAEEWINAFDYGYAGPGDDERFAITNDLVRHPIERDRHLARIALQAPDLRDDRPLNVTLVLDASGSMEWGDRVSIAREAAETIRQSLGSDDRIAVVHFTTDVIDRYTVAHSEPEDGDVARSIASLAAHDSTNVQAGLNLGVRLADEARRERPDAYNYIILMSDGVANVDVTDPFAILAGAPDADSRNPLRLITIGVGIENYNDVLLEQLAQYGNGWYRYLDTTDQARETFSRENWLALSTPFADQARAQVTWDPAVVSEWRIVGYENRVTPDHTFTQDRKEFAELPAAAATTVFYELILHDGAGASAALGSVEVRWVDPATGASVSQAAPVGGHAAQDFDAAGPYLRLGAIVGLAADRYSSLSPQVENARVDHAGIRDDLTVLRDELQALQGDLGSSQAYRDFSFLLDRLVAAAAELAPSSGYSQ